MSKQRGQRTATKSAKGSRPRSEKVPREPLVVFAFRLRELDRSLIHKAAGPAKATRFVLSAALAAASGDSKAFEELAAQAKTNRR